jgi:Spy/CpxP family protein refolding chaperone
MGNRRIRTAGERFEPGHLCLDNEGQKLVCSLGRASMKRNRHLAAATLLGAALSLLTATPAAHGQESWESYYQAAQQAYDGHNLFEARRLFLSALKEARQRKQDKQLTSRLENLADFYVQTDRRSQAEPLYKLLKKLRTRQG